MLMQIHTHARTHTCCMLTDGKHTINFAFNNLWRGDGSRSLSIFIAKGEDGRAQHGNARSHTSHLILLVVWNQRVQNSQVYPKQTSDLRLQMLILSTQAKQSSTIAFRKLFSLTFSSLLVTRIRSYHHLRLITVAFASLDEMFTIRRSFVSPFCQFLNSSFSFSHLPLSPPSLCLSISFSPPKLSFGSRSGTRNCW